MLIFDMCSSNAAVVIQVYVAMYRCDVLNGIALIIVMCSSRTTANNISGEVPLYDYECVDLCVCQTLILLAGCCWHKSHYCMRHDICIGSSASEVRGVSIS